MTADAGAALEVDLRSPVPPFEQLRTQIADRVAQGVLTPGTRLPPVRSLAADLGLAAGTVARAYKELEGDGVVVTAGRRGTVVAPAPPTASADAVDAAVARAVALARGAGWDRSRVLEAVKRAWEG